MAEADSLFEMEDFLRITTTTGKRADYVQGGGGNTSSKLDSRRMAVKASGFRMKDVSQKDGFVILDYPQMKEYMDKALMAGSTATDESSQAFIRTLVLPQEGLPNRRPSVEAGFHALLKTHMIHSHPVCANILACAQEGEQFVKDVFYSEPFWTVWLSYLRPGIGLSLGMAEVIRERGVIPDVWFIENHGLIVAGDDPDKTIELHDYVNRRIMEKLGGLETFPSISLESGPDGAFLSRTIFKGKQLSEYVNTEILEGKILYPDQLVYLNANMVSDRLKRTANGFSYGVPRMEAESIEETLLGYIYVFESIR